MNTAPERREFLRCLLGGGILAATWASGSALLSACKQKVSSDGPAPTPGAGACPPGAPPYRVVRPAASDQYGQGSDPATAPQAQSPTYGLTDVPSDAPSADLIATNSKRYERVFNFDAETDTFHLAISLDPAVDASTLSALRILWRMDGQKEQTVLVRDPAFKADGNTFIEGRFTALLIAPRPGRRVTLVLEGVEALRVLRAELEGEFDEPPPLALFGGESAGGFVPPGFTAQPRGFQIIPRSLWSAQAPRVAASKARWSKIVVHHSALYIAPGTDPASVVRSYQRSHIHGEGWDDIGYNFLVAPDGRVFEGRNGGKDAEGAHTKHANGETVGINFMGQFHDPEPGAKNEPTPQQLDSGARLIAWLAVECGIALDGRSPLSSGSRAPLPNVTTHREVGATFPQGGTACPGSRMYGRISQLRDTALRYKQEYSAPPATPPMGAGVASPC
jgi:hypothetical protein